MHLMVQSGVARGFVAVPTVTDSRCSRRVAGNRPRRSPAQVVVSGMGRTGNMVRDVVRIGTAPLRESPKARAALALLQQHG